MHRALLFASLAAAGVLASSITTAAGNGAGSKRPLKTIDSTALVAQSVKASNDTALRKHVVTP